MNREEEEVLVALCKTSIAHSHKINALEEAICPKVAARLQRLERAMKAQAEVHRAAVPMMEDVFARLERLESAGEHITVSTIVEPVQDYDVGEWHAPSKADDPDKVFELAKRLTDAAFGTQAWDRFSEAARSKIVDEARLLMKLVEEA